MPNTPQLFHEYLDIQDEDKKKAWLLQLEKNDPKAYQALIPLLNTLSQTTFNFTTIINQHAHQYLEQMPNFEGETVDKFLVGEKLGEGGMSVVYAAERENDTFEQSVVIKFFRHAIHHIIDSTVMFNEAKMLARLNHPNVVKVFDGGVFKNINYLVMERVQGKSLEAFLKGSSLNEHQKLTLFLSICSAVAHAHQHQILHADLKPENILVDETGTPKLIDFNMIQKLKDENKSDRILALSEKYASPEQIAGEFLTNASDIYSLGLF